MAGSLRSGFTKAIPWIAVVLVAIFAFSQVHRRGQAERRAAEAERAARSAAPAPPAPASPAPAGTRAALLIDEALTAEREAHRATADELAAVRAQLAAARKRAERLEALQAVDEARAQAVEAQDAASKQALADAQRLIEAGRRLVRSEPVRGWLEDAASGDADRLRAARARAGDATPEHVGALEELLLRKPDYALAAAKLASALPADEASTRVIVRLVEALGPADRERGLDAIGTARLMDEAVFERLLAGTGPDTAVAFVRRVAARASDWSDDERARIAVPFARMLAQWSGDETFVGARGFGLLALRGGAKRLAELLGHESPRTRAAAAHALSRVPDRDDAPGLRQQVPALLGDASLDVRRAGLLLAEAILGERLAFDPAAPAPKRRQALDRLKARFRD